MGGLDRSCIRSYVKDFFSKLAVQKLVGQMSRTGKGSSKHPVGDLAMTRQLIGIGMTLFRCTERDIQRSITDHLIHATHRKGGEAYERKLMNGREN